MAISNANLTILDGALGLSPSTGDQVQAKLGVCTAGTANVPTLVTSPSGANAFGTGPLVEAAKATLAIPGNGGVVMCKVPSTVAGSVGSTTAGSGNAGTGTVTVGGTPNDAYDVQLQMVQDGANLTAGTAAFQVSIDGGDNFSDTQAVPTGGTYTIPGTGLTVTFANGGSGTSFKSGDVFSSSSVAPGYSTSDLLAGVDAVAAGLNDVFLMHAVGQAASVSAALGVAAALSTKLVSLAGTFKYYRGLVELPHDTDANVLAAVTGVVAPRMMAVSDFTELTELDGTQRKRHAAWSVAARAGASKPGEDLGRVDRGALLNVRSLYRNEETTPALDVARVTTLRSITGKQGFFVTAPQMLEAIGSDYALLQYGRIIDIAAKVIHARATELLRADLDVDPTTGKIAEDQARAIEKTLRDALSAKLVETKNAQAVSVRFDRTTNLISNPTVNIDYRIVPRGYVLQLTGTLALQNPALAA
jgi:hypothetical protein